MQSNQLPRQYLRWRKWREIIQIWGLIIPGFAGIVISIVNLFFSPKDLVLNVLLFLFSILALALGLERYDAIGEERREAQRRDQEVTRSFAKLESEIIEVYQTLRSKTAALKLLVGHEEIYNETIRFVKHCKGSEIIRATSLVHYPDIDSPTPFRGYLETIAKTVGQAKLNKLPMIYKVVLAFEEHPPSDVDKQAGIQKRQEIFKANNALERLDMRYLNNPVLVHLLIVGNEGMCIGFGMMAGDPSMRAAISITNKDFIANIIRWYDDYLLPQAVRV
jgi:hypothetical protein